MVRQAADIVVRLDARGCASVFGRALDDIGVQCSLSQEVDAAELSSFGGEDPDELVADDLAFLFRVLDSIQPSEEAVGSVYPDHVHPEVLSKGVQIALVLLASQQPIVHEDAGQLISDRAMDQRCYHSRVDAARKGADHAA